MLRAYFIIALLLSTSAIALHFGIVQASTDYSDIPKPSIPEFTVKFVSGVIEVRIKNQPFVPTEVSGWNTSFYYDIRVKEHSAADWIELYNADDGFLSQDELSEYTVASYSSSTWGYERVSFPSGSQVDFQVEAMNGHVHRIVQGNMAPWYFTGVTSGWSETRTVTIGEAQTPTPSPETTPTPTASPATTPTPPQEPHQTEQIETIIGAIITIAVIGAGLGFLIYLIKRK